jgi:hypothetical protein
MTFDPEDPGLRDAAKKALEEWKWRKEGSWIHLDVSAEIAWEWKATQRSWISDQFLKPPGKDPLGLSPEQREASNRHERMRKLFGEAGLLMENFFPLIQPMHPDPTYMDDNLRTKGKFYDGDPAPSSDGVCPIHNTEMYYSPSMKLYACQDAKCEYGKGVPADNWDRAYWDTGYVFCDVCDDWHRPPARREYCAIEGEVVQREIEGPQ